jgi:hypothetical protein
MPGTVTVGCRLPAGLHLSVFVMQSSVEPVMGGGTRDISRASLAGRVTVRGSARRPGDTSFGEIVSGFGITRDVDADIWDLWLDQNKDSAVVQNGLIFAYAKSNDAVAAAKSNAMARTGLEGIDPGNLPDEFKRKITTATVEA